MFRKILAPLLGLLGLAALSINASASDPYGTDKDGVKVWKPYVVEKNCADGLFECTARIDYAPFQRSMVARSGSYWYQKPFLVHRYGDFRPQAGSSHDAWCSARYRTYDPATGTYVGRGYKRHRCISP
ncbi:BA14K family protein [Aestuariivirga sp.]|uniref:BA14K family protein n=1 Tax=Aestuariivirga sp. TaxID=2650926 RepID=UPI0025C72CA0|nr:BA14K family protein [Aestuariivirga sp.]MCA3555607.1 BA14K family protein [Aestuariivirga sp.]